jgi:antitoxin component YwqK of YwqJK toxin-antitoxin module
MKNFLLISFLFFIGSNLFCQNDRIDTSYYWENHSIWRISYSDSIGPGNYIGGYTSFYINGPKQSEVRYSDSGRERFVNYWLPDGTQTLKDGNGKFIYSDIEDSTIYEISDSIYHGYSTSYHHFFDYRFPLVSQNLPWKLEAKGNYEKGKRIGEWFFLDESGSNYMVLNFVNGISHGQCSLYYLNNGIVMESGFLDDCNRVGLWKKFDAQGNLSGEYNYQNGQKMGACTLYYPDGKIKAKGQYTQLNRKYKRAKKDRNNPGVYLIDARYRGPNVPAKTGIWYFYDENGKIIKTKKYKAKIEENESFSKIWI